MSSIIIVPVYVTEENGCLDYARDTLWDIIKKTDFNNHELFISDNGSCQEMQDFYQGIKMHFLFNGLPEENLTISLNGENLGTARAVNLGIKKRKPNQYVIKRDADTIVHDSNWVEKLEEIFERDPSLGIVGFKRNDLAQSPNQENLHFKTEFVMLPHEAGQKWLYVEKSSDVIGTCTMFNPKLVDAIGLMFQEGCYGFDDSNYSVRSLLAGFWNAFDLRVEIDHLDTGANKSYQDWKNARSGERWDNYRNIINSYIDGSRSIYEG